jgi:signal-transduction protein with cAMP-binding, CBS, and nucleotidyltransferase domain
MTPVVRCFILPFVMMVKEVMRAAPALDERAGFDDVLEAILQTGTEAVPIVGRVDGRLAVRQLVAVTDLPKLRRLLDMNTRGHAVGHTVLDLLAAMGRLPASLPTVGPRATLADAWGIMSEQCVTTLAVVEDDQVIGIVSLRVTWNEFPYRSAGAAFLQ